ncbi:MAG: HAD family phosphatase [Rhizomicrobium sp.]|jgi:HAD superfamily hydrolase (TIGR01509 family)
MRPVSAIIFDCDGVLVDSEVLALEIELAALSEAGLAYELDEYKARFMGLSTAAFHDAVDADSIARTGKSLPAGFRDEIRKRYRAAAPRLAEIPGARAAVARVAQLKAVASSSTSVALKEKLKVTDMWDLFAPHVYSADHVTHAKPAPDLFLHAAQALNVETRTCLVIEDSANGVKAARAAGMTVWGFAGGGHMDPATIDRLRAAGAARIVPDWPTAGGLIEQLT